MFVYGLVPMHHHYTSIHRNHLLHRSYLDCVQLHNYDSPYLLNTYVIYCKAKCLQHKLNMYNPDMY